MRALAPQVRKMRRIRTDSTRSRAAKQLSMQRRLRRQSIHHNRTRAAAMFERRVLNNHSAV